MPRTRQSQSGPESRPEQPRVVECPQCDTPVTVTPVTVLRPHSSDLKRLFKGDRIGAQVVLACEIGYED